MVEFTQISPMNRAFSSSHIITYKSQAISPEAYFLRRTKRFVSSTNEQEDVRIVNKFNQSDSSRNELFRLK